MKNTEQNFVFIPLTEQNDKTALYLYSSVRRV